MTILQSSFLLLLGTVSTMALSRHPNVEEQTTQRNTTEEQAFAELIHAQAQRDRKQQAYDLKAEELTALRSSKKDLLWQSKKESFFAILSGAAGVTTTFVAGCFGALCSGGMTCRGPVSSDSNPLLGYLCLLPAAIGAVVAYSFKSKSNEHTKEAEQVGNQIDEKVAALGVLECQLDDAQNTVNNHQEK
jgi:hypothetical protein